jgi:TldD protein
MEQNLQDLADKIIKYTEQSGVQYCDVRAEQQIKKSILIENKEIEHIRNSEDKGIGVRLIKNGAWSFCSITNPKSFDEIKNILDKTIKNSDYTNSNKKNKINLHNNPINKKQINFPVIKKPEIEELTSIGLECNEIMMNSPAIIRSVTNPYFVTNSKYFVNSEGSKILQNFTDVIMEMVATAHESGITQSVNITEGGRGGMELIQSKSQQSAKEISVKASELIKAKPVKEEKTTLVMNPDFVSLLTHEILGHPSEADRVLGKEMAWAGGAWWKGKIGEKIGSENLNVFDDPTIKESLGWYYYDDEGVETKKTNLIENGILKNHMQNRET